MEAANKRNSKKTTTTQFRVLVTELEGNVELARGAPVFGASKVAFDEEWRKIAEKVNSHGPPQRSANEWRKIFADLKCRTKKKIAENAANIHGTGGGPYRQAPLTDIEEAIDRMLVISRGAAPSGMTFGVSSTPTQVACRPPNRGRKSPSSSPSTPAVASAVESPAIDNGSMAPVETPRRRQIRNLPKRNFQQFIADSAKIQADAAKAQAAAMESIAESLKQLVACSTRQTDALEAIVANTTTEYVPN